MLIDLAKDNSVESNSMALITQLTSAKQQRGSRLSDDVIDWKNYILNSKMFTRPCVSG